MLRASSSAAFLQHLPTSRVFLAFPIVVDACRRDVGSCSAPIAALNLARRVGMKKNTNQGASTTRPGEARDDQKKAMQRIDLETTADGNAAGEIEASKLEGYLAHLEHLDVPLQAKIELIRALQQIMQSFVDRAFGDDSAQLACGDPNKTNVRSGSDVL